MKLRLILVPLAAVAIALPAALTADPLTSNNEELPTVTLASLSSGASERGDANMTTIPDGTLNELLGIPSKEPSGIRIAGRCGSSNYYCDSPGFTYCCGNATDGFYCAKDVNGC